MRKPPAELVEAFRAALADEPDVEPRRMFGAECAFVQGQMFAGALDADVFVRLDEAGRAEVLAQDGGRPFDPMGGRPMREYVVLPPSVVEDPRALRGFLARGLAFARGLPPKAKRSTKKAAKAPAKKTPAKPPAKKPAAKKPAARRPRG